LNATLDLSDFLDTLTAIAEGGRKCWQCQGVGDVAKGHATCAICHGTGREKPPDMIDVLFNGMLDAIEESGDVLRRKIVEPHNEKAWEGLKATQVTITYDSANRVWWWPWLPSKQPYDVSSVDQPEAARRLLLLWRKPCERCKGDKDSRHEGTSRMNDLPCPDCSGLGYFPQTLVRHGESVSVPESVGKCRCGSIFIAGSTESSRLSVRCAKGGIHDPVKTVKELEIEDAWEWAERHLLQLPPGIG
jgi:hypothetical protein